MSVPTHAIPAVPNTAVDLPWELAATIAERLRGIAPAPRSAAESADGARRLRLWRELSPFQTEDLDRAFAPLGVSAAELADLLGEAPERLRARLGDEPAWVRQFTAALTNEKPLPPEVDVLPEHLGFAELVRPQLRLTLGWLAAALDWTTLPAGLLTVLANGIPILPLAQAVQRTLTLELNVARVQGRLAGDTPEDRFHSFTQALRDPETALTLWREYPVLARHVQGVLCRWFSTRVEFAQHLAADRAELITTVLGGADPGRVTEVGFGSGDTHRGGRTVAIVRFERATVVYKPRSLAVDLVFNRYLDWFNQRDPLHPLRVLRVLDRGEHGWVEFAQTGPCAGAEELRAFYWRTGALLGLLHSLRATDIHIENIIAVGADPLLVDLEALFHTNPWEGDGAELSPPQRVYAESVLLVGLLPQPVVVRDPEGRSFTADLSGVAGRGGQSLEAVPVLEAMGTDEMRVVNRHVDTEGSGNLPSPADGAEVRVQEYAGDVRAGFSFCYRQILADREQLLAPGGLVGEFAGVTLRLILRATRFYGRVMEESLHPDFLRDATDRQRALSRLCEAPEDLGQATEVLAAELRAMWLGDIPFFEFTPGARDLLLDDGRVLPAVLDRAPLELVRERIGRMSEIDLRRQLGLIRDSFLLLEAGPEAGAVRAIPPRSAPGALSAEVEPLSKDELLAVAESVGESLLSSALAEGNRIGWLGIDLADERHWQIAPGTQDLYGGLAGIGLFLTYLAKHTGRDRWHTAAGLVADEVARLTARRAREWAKLSSHQRANLVRDLPWDVGGFGDLAGGIYYLAHAAAVLERPGYTDHAAEALPLLRAVLHRDESYDVLGGSAGAILGLLALTDSPHRTEALQLAELAADHLLTHRLDTESGYGWIATGATQPLTGLSHGGAGIAMALARLHALAPHPDYLRTITGTLTHENSHFVPGAANWLDLREYTPEGGASHAWCHGAPGIALARQDLLRHDFLAGQADQLRADLAAAMHTTAVVQRVSADWGGLGNHSLCHGELGNLDILLSTGALPAPELDLLLAAQLADAERTGWRCAVPEGTSTPGLMLGLAGIGYGLLRFAEPQATPSVLLLEAPAR
ncbi:MULTISPECIES: type 2 lanthipeptide synthetase LanM family protein [unclassified Crossiella]|uniref:type 2 lanthipeptide synthetase LanM family protein n=1 Tax=unclassified Crossiella TaxID=2620835 RepID=UPI0020004587|nr:MULTISPECIES: type 2 lanthipeptide synthetase LanM family protein [unclassified Crossiella]MCK2244309.1 type 2 lanthipeptide synthetase LanM family protein [Crossiella sp. S99.2]MCK2257863.1 type 2 lanthipeptide synthetase LanM family protein [Crossiella sp. S99.1]